MEQSLMDKLTILADSAKYDVACTSSGNGRRGDGKGMGNCVEAGICHSFSADGRCISLLKILLTNECVFDCHYCVNRCSNDVPRAAFTPDEVCQLTMEFYRRNYIEGLFLSSAVLGTPDYTTERMLAALRLLRGEYRFGGYIHAKAIPGTSPELLQQLGYLADRLSVNVELPSERSLNLLAPDKGRHSIFRPMKQIAVEGAANREEVALYRKAPRFAPAGQSTQMIVGATPDSDLHILRLLRDHRHTVHKIYLQGIGSALPRSCSAFISHLDRNRDASVFIRCKLSQVDLDLSRGRVLTLFPADIKIRFLSATRRHTRFHPDSCRFQRYIYCVCTVGERGKIRCKFKVLTTFFIRKHIESL